MKLNSRKPFYFLGVFQYFGGSIHQFITREVVGEDLRGAQERKEVMLASYFRVSTN